MFGFATLWKHYNTKLEQNSPFSKVQKKVKNNFSKSTLTQERESRLVYLHNKLSAVGHPQSQTCATCHLGHHKARGLPPRPVQIDKSASTLSAIDRKLFKLFFFGELLDDLFDSGIDARLASDWFKLAPFVCWLADWISGSCDVSGWRVHRKDLAHCSRKIDFFFARNFSLIDGGRGCFVFIALKL